MFGRALLMEHFCKFGQIICSEIAINANFNMSHYKSMANVNCHSNQSSYSIEIKKKIANIHSPGL